MDFPFLSYHFDTSNRTFQEAQDVGFPKLYGRNYHPETKFSGFGPWTWTPRRVQWVIMTGLRRHG